MARGAGFAWVHVHGCELLDRQTVHDQAYWYDGDLHGSEYVYYVATVEVSEKAHRAKFEVDFPMRRHRCVAEHEKWLAGLVTLAELAAELRLDVDDMDHLWDRFVDAATEPNLMFVNHQRDGHWLIDPHLVDAVRRHVATHPREYPRLPRAGAGQG